MKKTMIALGVMACALVACTEDQKNVEQTIELEDVKKVMDSIIEDVDTVITIGKDSIVTK